MRYDLMICTIIIKAYKRKTKQTKRGKQQKERRTEYGSGTISHGGHQ